MKVGILTFTEGTNIGQRLQNYALQQVINSLFSEVQVLTIRQGYPFNLIKRNIKNTISFFKNPIQQIRGYKRQRKFSLFNEKYIQFYPVEMPFSANNSIFAQEFDWFVAGSDQIWNPNSPFVSKNYFLTFAKYHQRLTYAPSFSVDEIPLDKINEYKKYLQGFKHITVREDRGAEIVKKLTNVPVEVVLDPTLLLERVEYDKIKKIYSERPLEKYILALYLGDRPQNDIDVISKQIGYKVFYIEKDSEIGPDEFLDVIDHAELVLTDSYHVTIFSIIYQRPFINFTRSGIGKTMNSRFETLYRMLNIRNRTWEYLKYHIDESMELSFSDIDLMLRNEKQRCKEILRYSIEECIQFLK